MPDPGDRRYDLTKTPDAERAKSLDEDDKEGYVLTRYFYDALGKFERDPAGMRNAYADLVGSIEVGKEMKRASPIQFSGEAAPELLHLAGHPDQHLLLNAERRLAAGDPETAQKLAQQALDRAGRRCGTRAVHFGGSGHRESRHGRRAQVL